MNIGFALTVDIASDSVRATALGLIIRCRCFSLRFYRPLSHLLCATLPSMVL